MSNRNSKSYWAGSSKKFLECDTEVILQQMTLRVSKQFAGDERKQIDAWAIQIEILKNCFIENHDFSSWGILLELPLTRLAKRIDCIMTTPHGILCIEFKIGASRYISSDIEQTEDYALSLRAFHQASHKSNIFPILCCSEAPNKNNNISILEGVSNCLFTNKENLFNILKKISLQPKSQAPNWAEYDRSSYSPTPSIIDAAKAIWSGHSVEDIGRTDSSKDDLEKTKESLHQIVLNARKSKSKVVCFVTGEPGAGKTLVGLDLVFSGKSGDIEGAPASLLSGNRPLVAVLREAIAQDAVRKTESKITDVRRETSQALQHLLDYLREHLSDPKAPPENVIVFDEAQRAWDAQTGMDQLKRYASEPEIFLDIMGRLSWACLVCLIGPGQEIGRGEKGFSLWKEALDKTCDNNNNWEVHCSPDIAHHFNDCKSNIHSNPYLYLKSQMRAYRSEYQGEWIKCLLEGHINKAHKIASRMMSPPAFISRELDVVKKWLKTKRVGKTRVGLLASSNAVRLRASNIPPSPRSNELNDVAHWFLKPKEDFRSSNALELPLSEYVCQGLEIDYSGLCWGYDLIWRKNKWIQQKMSSPKWQITKNKMNQDFRTNAYRVLLTRSRAGSIIYVPHGDGEDPSRSIEDMNSTYQVLVSAGCEPLDKL